MENISSLLFATVEEFIKLKVQYARTMLDEGKFKEALKMTKTLPDSSFTRVDSDIDLPAESSTEKLEQSPKNVRSLVLEFFKSTAGRQTTLSIWEAFKKKYSLGDEVRSVWVTAISKTIHSLAVSKKLKAYETEGKKKEYEFVNE